MMDDKISRSKHGVYYIMSDTAGVRPSDLSGGWIEADYELRVKAYCIMDETASEAMKEFVADPDDFKEAVIPLTVDLTPPILKMVWPLDHEISSYMFTPTMEYRCVVALSTINHPRPAVQPAFCCV